MDEEKPDKGQAERDRARRLRSFLDDGADVPGDPRDVAKLVARTTMKQKDFRRARKALEIAWEWEKEVRDWRPDEKSHGVAQQLAVCTYKDSELSPNFRFERALEVLEEIGLRDAANRFPETLRLGGAVFKRKWEFDGQLEHLIEALALYRTAYEIDPIADKGYGGVNAAFILDLLAARARIRTLRSHTGEREAGLLSDQAAQLRREVLDSMTSALDSQPELGSDPWFAPTYAELLFGLGDYDGASRTIEEMIAFLGGEDSWEAETSFRQLVAIAKAHDIAPPDENQRIEAWHPAWKALSGYFRRDEKKTLHALLCYQGKVGLALSGGGFRASLYHIGVLARLAEMDVLRRVEVISTVSGGSIVGAHYYLEVQDLLQRKTDSVIGPGDYVEVVRRLEKRFLAGVQNNLRMRTLSSVSDNLKMLFQDGYSRSHKIGELYESEFYRRIGPEPGGADGSSGPDALYMRDLLIRDTKADRPFRPKAENWKRGARVPVLLLNTTSLNSGHSWLFTATWMGEPAGLMGSEVDKNQRYQRIWYDDPANKRSPEPVRLGHAVAASACVPALFEPLELAELYEDKVVRLVDGGVHDNQGVQGLLDEGCTLILCSDASGQMGDAGDPPNSLVGVSLRSNSILMDRVREAEYQDLAARVDSRALEGLFFIHLKEGLPAPTIPWTGALHPRGPATVRETPYGIHPAFQEKIAALRTDLDCFSDVEAFALMLSGYNMARAKLKQLDRENLEPGSWGGFSSIDSGDAPRDRWGFRQADFEALLELPPDSPNSRVADLARQLDAGSALFFRAFSLIGWLKVAGLALVAIAAIGLVTLIANAWSSEITTLTWGGLILAAALAAATAIIPALRWLTPEKVTRKMVGKAVLGVFGAIVAKIHVGVIDPLYRRRGSLGRLLSR